MWKARWTSAAVNRSMLDSCDGVQAYHRYSCALTRLPGPRVLCVTLHVGVCAQPATGVHLRVEAQPDAHSIGDVVWRRVFGKGEDAVEIRSRWGRWGGLATESMQLRGGTVHIGLHLQPVVYPLPATVDDVAWQGTGAYALASAARGIFAGEAKIRAELGEATAIGTGFAHTPRKLWWRQLPVPQLLAPEATGVTLPHSDGKGWWVDVEVKAPLVGVLVSYRGHVRVQQANE